MAVDIQVVFPQQTIALSGVEELQGYDARILYCIGEDFSAVDEILINDTPAPTFAILGMRALVVRIPDLEASSVVNSLVVLSNKLTLSAESLLRYRFGPYARKVQGMMRLLQLFTKTLLQSPGTDIFSPNTGGGLLTRVNRQVGRTGQGLVGDVVLAVDHTARQLTGIQAGNFSLPLTERLLAANVVGSRFDPNDMSLHVDVELINQTGVRGALNLLL